MYFGFLLTVSACYLSTCLVGVSVFMNVVNNPALQRPTQSLLKSGIYHFLFPLPIIGWYSFMNCAMIPNEERELFRRFGPEYLEYYEETPRWILT